MFDVYKEHKLLKPQLKIQRVVLSRKSSISPKTSQFTKKPLKENEKSNMRGKSMPELRRSKRQQKTDGLESENNSSKKTHNTRLKSVKKMIKNTVNGIEELSLKSEVPSSSNKLVELQPLTTVAPPVSDVVLTNLTQAESHSM